MKKYEKLNHPLFIIILYDFCLPAVFILLIFMSMDARLNMWITASPSCSFISFSNMTSSGNRTLRFPGFCRANTLALRLIMCYLWECYALHGGLELSKILLNFFEKMAEISSKYFYSFQKVNYVSTCDRYLHWYQASAEKNWWKFFFIFALFVFNSNPPCIGVRHDH